MDFSRSGLGLETQVALRLGATYRFRHFGGGGRTLTATVRWCRLRATRRGRAGEILPLFRAGLVLDACERPTAASPETRTGGGGSQPSDGRAAEEAGPER